MKNKKSIIFASLAAGFYLIFIILTILLKTVDVQRITNADVGLASINKIFYKTELNKGLSICTDLVLYASIASLVALAGFGLYQLIKRKSLFKVDKDILVVGGLSVLMLILWVVFDKVVVVNYRPILIDGQLKPSYPSTHVLFTAFLSLSTFSVFAKYINKNWAKLGYVILAMFMIVFVAFGRVACGMHFLTDVFGGLFLALGLFFTYETLKTALFIEVKEEKEEEKENV